MFLKRIQKAMWWVRSGFILTSLPPHPHKKKLASTLGSPRPPINEAGTDSNTAYGIKYRGCNRFEQVRRS